MATIASSPTVRKVAVPKTFDTWVWLFMRWSGVLLIPLVWIHVLINDIIVGVHRIDLDYVALRWASLGWQAYDIALLGFAFAHGMNGLRYVVNDYVHDKRLQKVLGWGMLAAWAVITAIGAVAIIGSVRAQTGVSQ
jgi:succinate dehydrogenase / fumarate reductase membrane anchor subunit